VASDWTRRVLVVEDQAALRMLVCELLQRHGFETAAAADAATATQLFTEFDPDALLTDIDLGSRPSGAELAAMLSELAPHLAIVFLSSYPRAAAGATAMGIAHAVFVSKQDLDSADALVSALEQALSTRRVPAATALPHPMPATGSARSPAISSRSSRWSLAAGRTSASPKRPRRACGPWNVRSAACSTAWM
jgi:CheY-like chemotaxis protein